MNVQAAHVWTEADAVILLTDSNVAVRPVTKEAAVRVSKKTVKGPTVANTF